MDFTNCKYPRHQLIINEVANSSPGPDRVTFLITTIIYSSSPPFFFLAPRFWEPRGQPQPGFSLEARERVLGKRLLNGDGIENSKKENKTTTTIGLIMSKTSYVFTKKVAACVSVRFLFHYHSFSPYCRAELFKAEVG